MDALDATTRWALYDLEPLSAWGFDGVTLRGDAARAMVNSPSAISRATRPKVVIGPGMKPEGSKKLRTCQPASRPDGGGRGQARRFAGRRGLVSDSSAERLEQLAGDDSPYGALGGGVSLLTERKADPGQVGLETMLKEIAKLERVRAVGLWPDLFADTS